MADAADRLRSSIEYAEDKMRDKHVCAIADLKAYLSEIERIRSLVLDACEVFEHYDLPEHAFHYRRKLKPI